MLNTLAQYHLLPYNGMGIKMGTYIHEITTFINFRLILQPFCLPLL
jgi:hypothetical protein